MDDEQRASLDRYMAAVASGGATVLSNASRARKIIAALPADEQQQLADAAPPVLAPHQQLYPRGA